MPENQITYEGPNVAFFDVGTGGTSRSGENPGGGGETIVQSTYFAWDYPTVENGIVTNNGGFTGSKWWGVTDYNGTYLSPTQVGGYDSDRAVIEHLENGMNNLNDAFAKWQQYINSFPSYDQGLPVSEFANAVIAHGGTENCMIDR